MTLFVLGNVAKDSFYYLNNFPSSGETTISEKTLNDIETIKQELNQDYFKNGNKEKSTYVSNEL